MYIDNANGIPVPSVQGTARAGIVKTASDGRDIRHKFDQLPVYRKLFSAAGSAAYKTGAPVMTHLEMGKGADSQLDVLCSRGISPHRIIMSHLDRVIDASLLDYQMDAVRSGVYLQFDTIGRSKYHSDETEASFIAMLCEKGFQDRILIGLDTTNERMKSYGGSIGLDYIMDHFRYLLREFGVDDNLFHQFTVNNPKQALCFELK